MTKKLAMSIIVNGNRYHVPAKLALDLEKERSEQARRFAIGYEEYYAKTKRIIEHESESA